MISAYIRMLCVVVLFVGATACVDDDSNEDASPCAGANCASNEAGTTSNGTTSTSNGTSSTSNGTSSTSNGTTSTSNGTTLTSNGTTLTSNGTTATSNGTSSSGRRDVVQSPAERAARGPAWVYNVPAMTAFEVVCGEPSTQDLGDAQWLQPNGSYAAHLGWPLEFIDTNCLGDATPNERAATVQFTAPTSGLWNIEAAAPKHVYTNTIPRVMQVRSSCENDTEGLSCTDLYGTNVDLEGSEEGGVYIGKSSLHTTQYVMEGESIWITLSGCSSGSRTDCDYNIAISPQGSEGDACEGGLSTCVGRWNCGSQSLEEPQCTFIASPTVVSDAPENRAQLDEEKGLGSLSVVVEDYSFDVAWIAFERLDAEGNPVGIGHGAYSGLIAPHIVTLGNGTLLVEGFVEFPALVPGGSTRVWVIDSTLNVTEFIDLENQPYRDVSQGDVCDMVEIRNVCIEGSQCQADQERAREGRCQESVPPVVLEGKFVFNANRGGLRAELQVGDADRDLERVELQLMRGEEARGERLIWEFNGLDDYASNHEFSRIFMDDFLVGLDATEIVVTALDAAGHASEPWRIELGSPEVLNEGRSCDHLGLASVCAGELICAGERGVFVCGEHSTTCPRGWEVVELDQEPNWSRTVDMRSADSTTSTTCGVGNTNVPDHVFAFQAPETRTYTFRADNGDPGLVSLEARTHCAIATPYIQPICSDNNYGEGTAELSIMLEANALIYLVFQASIVPELGEATVSVE